ncbi:MAG: hypothetical protein ACK55Z_05010 [bacterium]
MFAFLLHEAFSLYSKKLNDGYDKCAATYKALYRQLNIIFKEKD